MVLAYPNFAIAVLVSILAFTLLSHGVGRVIIGGLAKILPNWVRGLIVVGGILTIALSLAVILFPGIAILSMVFLLSIALTWNGIDTIAAGVTGAP